MRKIAGKGEQHKQGNTWWKPLAVLAVVAVFFTALFYGDNKYQTPPPYGKAGAITLSQQDLERGNPIFLIDGWLLTDERVTDMPTYIGEFSNLARGELSVPPHGRARYQMTLRYSGMPEMVSLSVPRLSFAYTITLDGARFLQGTGNGQITFLLTSGDHVLVVETVSRLGYYSGMYFPPAIGAADTILKMGNMQSFGYALAFLIPLALAVFTLFLWRTGGGRNRWFALLCCCYALYMSRYFVFLFSLPVQQYWFLVQDLAFYGLCFCVVQITALAWGKGRGKALRWIRRAMLAVPLILLVLCLLIPVVPGAVFVHGKLTDVYYIVTFFSVAFLAVKGRAEQNWESCYAMAGCVVFGTGLLANLLFSNAFEPIRFFWQFEWCGLFLVLLFAAMMVSRSRRIIRENDMLTNDLEEQVKKRTEEVTQLLDERKAFFSDMAHDLKAPVFATQSFIRAIRRSGVGVDAELRGYLDQAEAKQWEMARRLQGLSDINALDKIEEAWVRISVKDMILELDTAYRGEAKVQSVHFFAEPPEQDAYFMAQPEKINILFENLIYNALKATPCNGRITISAQIRGEKIYVSIEDTGCGIPKEELPLIFQRFYVGAKNRGTGTGLGLYIVNSIVKELGGAIGVQSVVGKGTTFTMEFPRCEAI